MHPDPWDQSENYHTLMWETVPNLQIHDQPISLNLSAIQLTGNSEDVATLFHLFSPSRGQKHSDLYDFNSDIYDQKYVLLESVWHATQPLLFDLMALRLVSWLFVNQTRWTFSVLL